ncbi:MotA/TolQ/ExbB proton channel family protein [Curvivirga sp.]|uniref:MotA/TolQ/ExbB proton channel family protein n=1 Tax=Curvivirga sp. TaxID=2856848 RepID=UPI003B59C779
MTKQTLTNSQQYGRPFGTLDLFRGRFTLKQPTRYLMIMMIFTLTIIAGVVLIHQPLMQAFNANIFLNGIILAVLVIGIGHAFRTVAMLGREVTWIEDFKRASQGGVTPTGKPPRLMAPAATMLGDRNERSAQLNLSTTAMQTLLDGVGTRLDETRETGRYMVGLLVFLGLLGTFWGLMGTVSSVGDVVANLEISGAGGEISDALAALKEGLQAPLSGMGTAFSSSLFGLAGSLVLGFLSLQASQAQNRFYNDFEEWLSGLTRLSGSGPIADGEQSVSAYTNALLEKTADSVESLQRLISRSEEGRLQAERNMNTLNDRLEDLVDVMKSGQSSGGGMDASAVNTLRNIEHHLSRMSTDAPKGREDAVQEIRSEIRLLARTIAALGETSSN